MEQPVSYQGSKRRYAKDIVDNIQPTGRFLDFCCGTGVVSMEVVENYLNPQDVVMVDNGPWGLFWNLVGSGRFSLAKFQTFLNEVPEAKYQKDFAEELSKQKPTKGDIPYVFLILQACSFGGKAIWMENGQWKHQGFRKIYPGVKERTFFPKRKTLYKRVATICEQMNGILGLQYDITKVNVSNATVYIDPPYDDTSGYKTTFDVDQLARKLSEGGNVVYVSEKKALTDNYVVVGDARKSDLSSKGNKSKTEYLSIYEVQ